MDSQQRGVILMLRSALTGEKLILPEEFDLERAYKIIVNHQVMPLVYEGAMLCGVDKRLPVMQKLFQGYCQSILHNERQAMEFKRVCSAFEDAAIDYLPLKGFNLKVLYPKQELRLMGDADILIRQDQYPRIRQMMLELGFEEQAQGAYDYSWGGPNLHLELHWRLISPKDKDLCAYFGDGWKRAVPAEKNTRRYAYTHEDELIYLFAHFVKHYRDSGIGLRHVTDLWLYRRTYAAMDWTYVESQLDKLHLLEFYKNVCRLLGAWFEDELWDEKTQFITQTIFQSGSWGKRSTYILASAVREKKNSRTLLTAKLKRLWKLTFLPLWQMKQMFPILTRLPALLPVFWGVRAIRTLFFTKGKIAQHSKEFSYMNQQRVSEYEQALHYVGLDFNFEE